MSDKRPQPTASAEANQEQIDFWNEAAGDRWVSYQRELDAQLAPFGEAATQALIPESGQQLLDIGCGCGTTTMELAKHVAARGNVDKAGRATGVDISSPMLEIARRRAATAVITNVDFVHADAQSFAFEQGRFDGVFSRFGVMFFSDPTAAFTNIAGALRSGGRMSFICWREIARNPWMVVPTMAAAQHVPIEPPTDPTAPGPFAFADDVRVRTLLDAGGFVNIELNSFDPVVTLGDGGDAERTSEFMLALGPVARVLDDIDEAKRETVRHAVRDALIPFESSEGVRMDASCWLVTATRP